MIGETRRERRDATARIALNAHLLALGDNYRNAGISSYIYHLLRYLPRVSNYQYTAWMNERGGTFPGVERRVTPLLTSRPAARILWEQLLQPYGVSRLRPALLHGLAFVLPLRLTVPGVITIYDLTFLHVPEAFRPLNRMYLRVMTTTSARRAAHVCAIAEHGRQDIARRLGVPLERISVIYPGLDPRFATPPAPAAVNAFREERGLPQRYVLYLGTLEPRKNVPALVRAFAALRRRQPEVKLVLAGGKGWGYDTIFAEVERLGLEQEVLFPGFVPAEEQPLWYAAADLFVYPSLYEGFGLPPLEAMACGTPVITSDAASLSEVVGAAGIIIPPADEARLTEAMAEILDRPSLRAERGEAGLVQAARFDWGASALAQAAVYRKVLEASQ